MSRKLPASLALLAFLIPGPAWARTHSVKKGETLSHIAAREFGRPIYGPKGSLQKLLQKNPEIHNPDRIRPKQIIRLSDEEAKDSLSPGAPAPEVAPVEEPLETKPASEPVQEPAPAQAAEPAAKFGVKLGLGLSKDEVEGVDHERRFRTVLDSELQTKMDLDAYYKPSEDTRVGLSLGVKNAKFKDSNDGRFEGRARTLYKLSVFGEMKLADRWHLGLELGSEQSFFFKQKALEFFAMEEVFVDFASVSAGYDILVHNSWRWGLHGQASFLAPADAEGQDVRKGSSYQAATRLSYEWNSALSVEGTLQYGRRSQGIDGIRQKTTERGLEIALRYEF